MDLRDYLAILRQRWFSVLLITVLVVLAAGLVTAQATPQYASTTRLFVTTSQSADEGQALQGSQFSMQRVKSYADLVTQNEITQRVVSQLDLDETPAQLASKITAEAALDTVILNITVTDASPERAQRIAEKTAEVFVDYVKGLETPPGADQPTIKTTVTNQATISDTPVSPQPVRNLGLGLVLGLLLGAGVAVLRETLDSTVKTQAQLEQLAGAPTIGSIPFDSKATDAPLLSDVDSYSPRAEAFRVLRTNLQFIDPDGTSKVFVVTSPLPGEGKSTTATNLALALAEGGQNVALVEGDLRRPRVSHYLGAVEDVGLTTVLVGRVTLDEALQETHAAGLTLLAAGRTPPNPAELLQSQQMAGLVDQLRQAFDIVLIDAPPLLPVTDAALLASIVDGAILVVRHGKTTADQVRTAVDRLEGVGAKPAATVFSMTPVRKGRFGYGYGYGYGYAPTEGPRTTSDTLTRPAPHLKETPGSPTDRSDPSARISAASRPESPGRRSVAHDLDDEAVDEAIGDPYATGTRRLDASRGLSDDDRPAARDDAGHDSRW